MYVSANRTQAIYDFYIHAEGTVAVPIAESRYPGATNYFQLNEQKETSALAVLNCDITVRANLRSKIFNPHQTAFFPGEPFHHRNSPFLMKFGTHTVKFI